MRDYTKVSPSIWSSSRFRGLDSVHGRYAMLYLLTNAHQNSIGCYRVTAAYACDDMGFTVAEWDSALSALEGAELIAADPETSEIFIRRWFVHNPPTNPKHLLGSRRLVDKIKSDALRALVGEELDAASVTWSGPTRLEVASSRPAPAPAPPPAQVRAQAPRHEPYCGLSEDDKKRASEIAAAYRKGNSPMDSPMHTPIDQAGDQKTEESRLFQGSAHTPTKAL